MGILKIAKIKYTDSAKAEWNRRTAQITATKTEGVVLSDIFEKYLPKSKQLTCIEIGSVPGNFLTYFYHKFGYQITGIDFSDNSKLFHETMKKNGIKNYKFINDEFLGHKFTGMYDVVTSFGFIEHFDDTLEVLGKHVDLVKPGGYLAITIPNFRFLQYLYHSYFDRNNLEIHNLKSMHIGYLKRYLKRRGLNKIVAGYFGNLSVWRQEEELDLKKLRMINAIHRWVSRNGKNLPNSRLYSPYILLIYKKPERHSYEKNE
ncbi:class I SAM-dependent methyltransferase [Candidatus Saccharibacteria bacterium]|nr:class I SAM-dependent methyltransferase [Candidatus Saccharibacteria bacterium]